MLVTNTLSEDQRRILRNELARSDLSIFSCVALAKVELATGHYDAAIARLLVDADKIRTISRPLYDIVRHQHA